MKHMTPNLGRLAILLVTLSISACTLFMPGGNYTAPRQNKDFVHLYTSILPAANEWNTNEELRLKKAVFDHSSPEDLPVLYLFPDGLKDGQFMIVHPESVSINSPEGSWGFDVQSIFSDNGSGFLAKGWYDSDAEGSQPPEDGIYRYSDYATTPTLLADSTDLYSGKEVWASLTGKGKLLGLTWHPPGLSGLEAGYQALWTADDLLVTEYSQSSQFLSDLNFIDYPNAIPNIDGLFTRLNGTNWPATTFWNTSTTSLDNFGFAPAGNIFWLQASRHSSSTGESETWAYVFGPELGNGFRSIDTERVAGRAGPYLLVQGREHDAINVYNTHYFAAHSAEGVEREFEVYGQTVAYLGEQESSGSIRLLFASISILHEANSESGRAYYISVYALPLEALTPENDA